MRPYTQETIRLELTNWYDPEPEEAYTPELHPLRLRLGLANLLFFATLGACVALGVAVGNAIYADPWGVTWVLGAFCGLALFAGLLHVVESWASPRAG